MDTLTHGIVGALIGKSFFAEDPGPLPVFSWRESPRTPGRVAIVAATLGAIFPDIDVFAGALAHNSLAIMTWHRNITHSLVLLPVWAVMLALLTRWLAGRLQWPAPALGDLTAIYAVGLGSHIFLDVITSFGTMVWSPIAYARPAWDWVFIIDLIVTSLALMPQLAAWAFRRPNRAVWRALPLWVLSSGAVFAAAPVIRSMGRSMDVPFPTSVAWAATAAFAIFFILPLRHRTKSTASRSKWCRVGLALLAGYISFAGTMHHSAMQQVTQFAEEARVNVLDIGALPLPPSAARWSGLISSPEGVYRLQFNELGSEPLKIQFFPNAADNRYIDAARGLHDVQTFLWFARFPVWHFVERNGQEVVQISDLRFYGALPQSGPPSPAAPPSNFTFEVVFTPDGRVVSQGLRPESEKVPDTKISQNADGADYADYFVSAR
jgi:membrane-bound metal-dependent hydrolase YbcI (DUF457 family)